MHLHKAHHVVRISHYLSEFAATFIFVFMGTLGIAVFMGSPTMIELIPPLEFRFILVVLSFVVPLVVLIFSPLGKISGAHMNPAVSFAFWLEKHLPTIDFIFYVLAQLLAGISASLLVLGLFPEMSHATQLGVPHPHSPYRFVFEVIGEIGATAVLMSLLFFFLSEEHLVKYTGGLVGLYLVFINLLSLESISLNLNPARYLGAAVAMEDFEHIWLYIMGPIIGAGIAVLIHKQWEILKRPKYFRLNHEEGFIEVFFHKFIKGRK